MIRVLAAALILLSAPASFADTAPWLAHEVTAEFDLEAHVVTITDRIDRRVDRMMDQGLEAEVRGLLSRGYDPQLKSMQSLGYRHLTAFIAGQASLDETVRTLKRDHRRYAKRQLTWFRADPSVHWMTPETPQAAVDRIGKFLA